MFSRLNFLDSSRWRLVLISLAIMATGLTAYRTWTNWSPPSVIFDWENRGHSDFHNGLYQPMQAFNDGVSPYIMDVREDYDMCRPVPAFSPALFVAHWPLSKLSLGSANVAFFVMNIALFLALAWMIVNFSGVPFNANLFLTILVLSLLSRPGHQSLFTGYFTIELAIGTFLALHFARSAPWIAALGLLLTSFKPNFVIPLMALMACRRDFAAVTKGIILCALGVIIGVFCLSFDSNPIDVLRGIVLGQQSHESNPTVNPLNTWVRIDIIGMLSKPLQFTPGLKTYLLTMFPLIAIPGYYLWQQGKSGYENGAIGPTGLVIGMTMLVAFYHSTYDALVLIAPWTGLVFFGERMFPMLGQKQRILVAMLTSVPAANYLSTLSGRKFLGLSEQSAAWQWLSVSSGLALVAAIVFLMIFLFQANDHGPANAKDVKSIST